MQLKEILIYQTNNLACITINSIKKNMPDWKYKVVKVEDGIIKTALNNCDKTTLVVESGVILNIQDNDLPPLEVLNKYHMAKSKKLVFGDHDRLCGCYEVLLGHIPNGGVIDLSVFIINPSKWDFIPETDIGFWNDIKTISIPRYMNHRTDVLVYQSLSARDCFMYGALGEQASIHNYIECFKQGHVNMSERFAYCLDKYLNYLDDVSDTVYNMITKVAKENKRYTKFRKQMSLIGD